MSLRKSATYSPRTETASSDSAPAGTLYYQGDFHRRDTLQKSDFGYISYTTNIPCANSFIAEPNTVAAYAQTGEEVTGIQSGNVVAESDIGLQFSAKSPPPGQKFSVQNYLLASPGGNGAGAFHWACNQAGFSVTFYADQSTSTLVLATVGTSVEQGAGTSEVDMLPVDPATGFSGDCRSSSTVYCVVKRDTALAKTANTVFPDGTYFAVQNPGTTQPVPILQWNSVQTGYYEANGTVTGLQFWSNTQWSGCPGQLPNEVFHSGNAYMETAGIDVSTRGAQSCTITTGIGLSDI